MFFLLTVAAPPPADRLEGRLVALAEGHMAALDEVYALTRTPVYAFALSILKNPHDAEDVLQDTYIRLVHFAGNYRPEGKPLAWILTVTRNLCYQRLRARKNQPAELEESLDGLPEAVTPEERVLLQTCMEKLTDEERQVVTLHAVAGFKHREIAQMLGLTLPAVLSRYNRAIHKLRKLCEGVEP